jgi:hypothetical protein
VKRFRVPSPSLLAILVLPLLACGFACRSDTGFVLHQVTLGGPLALEPEVSGDRVAWSVFDGPVAGDFTDTEICTWTPTDGTLRLTDNELDEGEVQVSGDRVVWQCNMFDYNRNGERVAENYDFEIFTWTPDSGVVRLTANDTWDHLPQVSGDRVVWRGVSESVRGRDPEIFTWTPSEGVVQLSENDDEDTFPEVSGDRVVWRGTGGADEGADYEIFTWTPSEGVVQLTEDENDDMYPRVDGNRAVWECEGAILAWTPTEGAVRLSGDGRRASCPQIAGGRIVWMATGDGDGGNDRERRSRWMAGGLRRQNRVARRWRT